MVVTSTVTQVHRQVQVNPILVAHLLPLPDRLNNNDTVSGVFVPALGSLLVFPPSSEDDDVVSGEFLFKVGGCGFEVLSSFLYVLEGDHDSGG